MLKYLQKTFSLTTSGRQQVGVAIIMATLHNISVVLPTFLLFAAVAMLLRFYRGESANFPNFFYFMAIAMVLMGVIFIVYKINYLKSYYMSYDESANTRIGLAEKLRKLPLSYFGKKDLSDLTSTLINDVATTEHALSAEVPQLFGGIISGVLIVLTMFGFNVKLSLAMFSCLPVVILVMALAYKVGDKVNHKTRVAKLSLSDALQEYFDNMKLMHASRKTESYKQGLFQKIRHVVKRSLIYEVVVGVFVSFSYNLLRVGMALTVIVGSVLMVNGEVDIYTMLLFLFVASQVYDPLTSVLFRTGEFFFSLLSAGRIREIEEFPSQTGEKTKTPNRYDLDFQQVRFAYNKGQTVLHGVSFTAKQGEITALVGPSGCGKSTLSKLACRFWDVDEGCVLLGGEDVRSFEPEGLLQSFSVVFQDVVLFNDSIYNNIKIGKKDATEEEIHAAAKMAQCDDFIRNLPEGYNTNIGENGKTLSGGERQRISIARAFLKDAPIILLDEATASLDPENETLIQEALSRLLQGKTVIIIAHRLRTVENCDKIVVLEEGKVVEQGTHAELMQETGLYHRLFSLQRESLGWTV